MDLSRLATAGSVDDGKSTLIGRLLYDAKAVLADQLAHVEERSVNAARPRAAHRRPARRARAGHHDRRRVPLVRDAEAALHPGRLPGHAQYTRNMVTGASTADLALVLVDARAGLTEQSRRHATIAALLRIRHVIVAVNKMDLVGYAEERFDEVAREVLELGAAVGLHEVEFIPISALNGDNVVERRRTCPGTRGRRCSSTWRRPGRADRPRRAAAGPARAARRRRHALVRRAPRRGDAEGGRRGRRPAVRHAHAGAEVRDADGTAEQVEAPLTVSIALEDEVDVARGELIAAVEDAPAATRELTATLCWLGDSPAAARPLPAQARHPHRSGAAGRDRRPARLRDARVAARRGAALNDIARVSLRLGGEIAADAYEQCHATGAFILIDETTNDTVAAGMVTAAR